MTPRRPTLRDRHPWLVLGAEIALALAVGLAFWAWIWITWASGLD